MTRRTTIGFDRRIDLEWLDAAAAQAAEGASSGTMRTYLWNLLDGVVRGDTPHSARGKTVTVLNHIWGDVPSHARGLQQHATTHLAASTSDERLALHWAMMVGTYPLFTDAATAIGRLLALQGHFTLALLSRRLVDAWGDRSTLKRAVQRIVRSMVQWDVVRETESRGTYQGAPHRRPVGPGVSQVVIESLLLDAEEGAMALDRLATHPATFPFEIDTSPRLLRVARHLRVDRQGLDTDYVELRNDERE